MSDATVTSIVPYIEAAKQAAAFKGLRLTWDPEADAAYLYLVSPETIRKERTRTIWAEEGHIAFDLDAEGRVLGIEILGPQRTLRPETIEMAGTL